MHIFGAQDAVGCLEMNHLLGFNARFLQALGCVTCVLLCARVLGRQAIERAGLFQRHGQRLDAISHLVQSRLAGRERQKIVNFLPAVDTGHDTNVIDGVGL